MCTVYNSIRLLISIIKNKKIKQQLIIDQQPCSFIPEHQKQQYKIHKNKNVNSKKNETMRK